MAGPSGGHVIAEGPAHVRLRSTFSSPCALLAGGRAGASCHGDQRPPRDARFATAVAFSGDDLHRDGPSPHATDAHIRRPQLGIPSQALEARSYCKFLL